MTDREAAKRIKALPTGKLPAWIIVPDWFAKKMNGRKFTAATQSATIENLPNRK